METKDLDLVIASDLFQYGVEEDGRPFIGEFYYIQATDVNGNRWNHYHRFHGVSVSEVEVDEGEMRTIFRDVRVDAVRAADHLLRRIKEQGMIDIAYWEETRPAYGSAAYQDYGQFNDLMQEYNDRMQGE